MKCGVCGQHYGDLMVKHAEVCDDDTKAQGVAMCGDCLTPLAECLHSYYLRPKKTK